MELMTGKDYPHLCRKCRAAIDTMAEAYADGCMGETDDEEAACMYLYDHKMFCGGIECNNPSK